MSDPVGANRAASLGTKPILIASHRRSGTHVAIDFIRKQFPGTSPTYRWLAPPSTLYVDLDSLKPGHHNPSTPERIARAIERAPRIVIRTHTLPADDGSFPEFGPNHEIAKAIIEQSTVINMDRDGRDVLSSQHLFDQTFHTDTPAGFGTFLRGEFGGLPRPAYWAKHVATWADPGPAPAPSGGGRHGRPRIGGSSTSTPAPRSSISATRTAASR